MIRWMPEELKAMAAWDEYIDKSEWSIEDEEASRFIAQILNPVLYQDLVAAIEIDGSHVKKYVPEHRPGKGKRKSKGNVPAQKKRRYLRNKLKV